MPFDLETWKTQFKDHLPGWKERMQLAGTNSVYAFICAATLGPLADSLSAGDVRGAYKTVYAVLGESNQDQVVNLMENWQDEANAAQKIERSQLTPGLRAELDAVLDKLNALPQAAAVLSEADRQWFLDSIKAELPRLGSRISYEAVAHDSAVIVQGNNNTTVGAGGVYVGGNVQGDVVAGDKQELQTGDIHSLGDTLIAGGSITQHFYGSPAAQTPSLPPSEAQARYLNHLIAAHQNLRLQGIRAGSQPLSVALEKVYISLTAREKHPGHAKATAGNNRENDFYAGGEWSVGQAMQRYPRLVVIGDPGCGKTTLLAYLTLTYARARSDQPDAVQQRLGLPEQHLPILLPLRDLGRRLKKRDDLGQDGPALLLDYLLEYYRAQRIELPADFFDPYLENGRALLLLDGLDELAEKGLRARAARLVERFAQCYPDCRYLVTSRKVGYEGTARLAEGFGLAEVREFSPAQVRQFVHDWTLAVETTLNSDTPEIRNLAADQAARLVQAIETNPRVGELAVNPLLLTVIALVHRYRAQLPERRSELYEEAVKVLLGNWDQAKGLQTVLALAGRELDPGDRRSLLEPVAFWLHEHKRREIELDELRRLLLEPFQTITGGGKPEASKAFSAFLEAVHERSGLFVERGAGEYGFAHLTFQEYLAARALADRADALTYTAKVLNDPWWREVILLQAGYLSTQGKTRVTALVRAILEGDGRGQEAGFIHLLLAAECIYDIGPARLQGDLLSEIRSRLRPLADLPLEKGNRPQILRKIQALNALQRIESGSFQSDYWRQPWGEPVWVTIPAGPFQMGSNENDDEKPVHTIELPAYAIAVTPVTNAQYALYVQDAGAQVPASWRGGQMPKGLENHPVVRVEWNDALAYCRWLSEKTGKQITLPSESEWEKAARGTDGRQFPWGNEWRELNCNSDELGLGETTPVGVFLNGASPYGVLDLSGNVWEWTRSKYREYPYRRDDGREDLSSQGARVLRGGSFYLGSRLARCAARLRDWDSFGWTRGFRVALPLSP